MNKIQTTLTTITPEMARRYLQNNPKNRLLKQRLVDRLADDIKNGDFHITHQGIAFDTDGNLLDGQHRLAAIVQANKSAEIHVTTGLPPETMNAIDVGSKRTHADALDIQGHSYPTILAAAAQIYNAYFQKKLHTASQKHNYLNNYRLVEFIKQHPEITAAVEWTMHQPKQLKQLGSQSVVAFWAIFHHKNKSKAHEFFRALSDNYSETRHHPAVVLNEHILRRKAGGVLVARSYLMAAFIRSWTNFLSKDMASNIIIKDPNPVMKEFK